MSEKPLGEFSLILHRLCLAGGMPTGRRSTHAEGRDSLFPLKATAGIWENHLTQLLSTDTWFWDHFGAAVANTLLEFPRCTIKYNTVGPLL